jgi:MoxR-like ATPase
MGFGVNSSGDDLLGSYLDNINQEKPNLSAMVDEPIPENELTNEDVITSEDVKKTKIAREASAFTANIVVETIDVAFSEIVGAVAKLDKEERKELKADEDVKETYKDAWSDYLKDKGTELSPGVLLIILTLGIYAPKIPMALDMRKVKEENKGLTNELEEKNKQIAKLQQQLRSKS